MTEDANEALLVKQSARSNELDPYGVFVTDRLKLYPETSAAQMYEWLKDTTLHYQK